MKHDDPSEAPGDESARPVEASRAQLLLRTGLALIHDSIVILDAAGCVTDLSDSAELLIGLSRQLASGLQYERVLQLSGLGDVTDPGPIARCLGGIAASGGVQACQLLSRDGRRLRVRLSCRALLEQERVIGAMLMLEDITEQTLIAQELVYHRQHDPVTGLLNRGEFEHRLAAALGDARERGIGHVLCHVDVDQFKLINDTLGYHAGDELLRRLATLFRSHLKTDDVLARVGGDEFGILIRDTSAAIGQGIVDGLMESTRGFRFDWESQKHATTVSIGVAEIGLGTASVAQAFADADAACYEAKDAGRDRARWFVAGDANIRRRHGEMAMVGRISQAIDNNQFLLFFEDVVAVAEPGRVRYRELLVRMRGDDGKLVQPSSFIAAAERFYLMAALDRWVMDTAFDGVARLADDGVIYAVNVSGMSLSDDQFLTHVIASLERSGVAPARICFEITETSAITHLSQAVRFINQLADRGCHFAVDDFGAGMASFAYLKNLPVQFVKIDGSFVRSMQDSAVDRGLVEAINRIGHELSLCTIAEHVEDTRALQMLAEIGVDWVQGHAVAAGRPFDELLNGAGARQEA